jgi:hypothetical protein
MKQKNYLYSTLIFSAFFIHLLIATQFHTRAWIDEMHVFFNQAYKIISGFGLINEEWNQKIRDYLPPLTLAIFLKFLIKIGIEDASTVHKIVSFVISFLSCLSIYILCKELSKKRSFKTKPVWLIVFSFFNLELIRLRTTGDLSVIGLPPLLLSFSFFLKSDDEKNTNSIVYFSVACFLISLSSFIRFQYALIAFIYFVYYSIKKPKRILIFSIIALITLSFDFILNTIMYKTPTLPIINYYLINTIGGLASSYGTTPFYFGFELFWRMATESVFLGFCLYFFRILKLFPPFGLASIIFFLIHIFIPHKEYRFFYPSATMLSICVGYIVQMDFENVKQSKLKFYFSKTLIISFVILIFLRGFLKTDFKAYQVPSVLLEKANKEKNLIGIITVGWGGIYQGCNYDVFKPIPCYFFQNINELKNYFQNHVEEISKISHIVIPSNLKSPCLKHIATISGGSLYECSQLELNTWIQKEINNK